MPLDFKKTGIRGKAAERALERRVLDDPLTTKTERQIQIELNNQMSRTSFATFPAHPVSTPIQSQLHREFVKDAKVYASLLAEETSLLEKEIIQSAESAFASLDDLQKELLVLDSLICEDEVRSETGYNNVRFNKWARPKDLPLDYEADSWLTDPKSGITFGPSNICDLVPSVGLTLPHKEVVKALISDITIDSEASDYGDTDKLIVSGNPMDLISNNKTFRHVIVRREFDGTSRSYTQEASSMTILIELSGRQYVNHLKIRPIGNSPVKITNISYFNESGTKTSIAFYAKRQDVYSTYMFEPVRSRFISVTFEQAKVVAKTELTVSDPRTKKVNEFLRGAGFTQLLNESEESIQGRVYDFSLETIELGLISYTNMGIYRSDLLDVSGIAGGELVMNSFDIEIDTTTGSAEKPMESGSVRPEMYIGLQASDAGVELINSLIPMPHSSGEEKERLITSGNTFGIARTRFIPDVSNSSNVVITVKENNTALTIGTDFEVSLDGGNTYLSTWAAVEAAFVNARLFADNFYIKILSLNSESFYNTTYKPYRKQYLLRNQMALLLDQKLVLDESLKDSQGSMQTVIVMHSTSNNPYVTPVVESTILKVREYVS